MDLIAVGYVARAHGVRGELRVHLHDPSSETLYQVERVFVGGAERRIESARSGPRGAVLLLLEALKGQAVEVPRAEIPLEEDEVLLTDLLGFAVVDESGAPLGEVARVQPGAQDLLVLHDRAAGVERLFPLVDELVVELDLDGKRLVVSAPEGLPSEPLREDG